MSFGDKHASAGGPVSSYIWNEDFLLSAQKWTPRCRPEVDSQVQPRGHLLFLWRAVLAGQAYLLCFSAPVSFPGPCARLLPLFLAVPALKPFSTNLKQWKQENWFVNEVSPVGCPSGFGTGIPALRPALHKPHCLVQGRMLSAFPLELTVPSKGENKLPIQLCYLEMKVKRFYREWQWRKDLIDILYCPENCV